MSRRNDIERLIAGHQRRLQKLKDLSSESKKQSSAGNSSPVPAEILIEIEDLQAQIPHLQKALNQASGQHKDNIQRAIEASERRLQKLQSHPSFSSGQGGDNQEIAELQAKVQQLQAELESASNDSHREVIQGVLIGTQRRLQSLIKKQSQSQQTDYEQEIVEIEVEIQQLQRELERWD